MEKSELQQWLQEEYRQWKALLAEIGPERMEQPGVNGDWSMKDIVAHLTGWQRHISNRLAAAARDEPEPSPPWPADLEEEDDINAWIYETSRHRSLHEVLDETDQMMQQLFTVIEELPDDVRVEHIEPQFYLVWLGDERFLPGEFFNHFHDDHEPDVRAWLARVAKQSVGDATMDIPAILISQYLASLEMLKQTIIQCPESIWNAESDNNKFWQVAYHALFFVHEYLQESAETAMPWARHRRGYEDFPAPQGGEPYDKDTILEYLAFCQREVTERVPQLKLEEPEGFGDDLITMELQLYSIRHLMQHTGELMERLGARTGAEIDWVGWKHD